jgi:hypothetical protein
LSSRLAWLAMFGWADGGGWCDRVHTLRRDLRLALAEPGKRRVRRTLKRGRAMLAPLVEPAKAELEPAEA